MTVIRVCTPGDVDMLNKAWPLTGDVHVAHWRAQIDGSTTFLVAWQTDVPLGSAVIRWNGFPDENARQEFSGCVEVCHLHVRNEFRGRGVGSALVLAAESMAIDRGVTSVGIAVADDSPRAAALYVRLGYQPSGVFDVSEYDWRDDAGNLHHATERNEALIKALGASAKHAT